MALPVKLPNPSIELDPIREWETRGPDSCRAQQNLSLADDTVREEARLLTKSRKLGVRELRRGLELTAFSHVGRVQLGEVIISILPKLNAQPLITLLRYAYGLRDLGKFSDTENYLASGGLQDLLCVQLAEEVKDLLNRGLVRGYLPKREDLASPRGRLDLAAMGRQGPLVQPVLPCVHHPRIADNLINQVILAGLRLAVNLSTNIALRSRLRRLIALLDAEITQSPLDFNLVARAQRHINRLNRASAAALNLIGLLLQSLGISLPNQPAHTRTHGFLFDMNSFFQNLISRLLHDHLPAVGLSVKDEKNLQGMVRWGEQDIPGQRLGSPRPDYAIMQNGKVRALLDAKYRDIWQRGIPSGWLYQVSFYALANGDLAGSTTASIIYPSDSPQARASEIEVLHPLKRTRLCSLWLRPVNLSRLAVLIGSPSPKNKRKLAALAQSLAMGSKPEI